ncbi:MAG: ABC transporter substrate-binding protein [Alphaproteobacteria bacterium]|nr:ABC transporter substrate-binding protein [Alphaproteobacteria bacterium]
MIAMKLALTTLALTAAIGLSTAQAQTLRIGLAEDPDALDPTTARTFVGRIVFASLCDKLFDINAKLEVVPQLATAFDWSADGKELTIKLRDGVVFHDGEKMDAAAVKYSLDRHLKMQGSFRRAEISVVQSVDVVDPLTVKLTLASPFSPLIAALTDRAGMIVSPKAAEAAGAQFANKPVCAGPFRFVERVAQDRIVLERFANYWDKGRIHVERVVFQPIPDSTVRLANLQAGGLELIERVPPTDVPQIKRNNRLVLSLSDELGYQGLTLNVANGDRAKGPIGDKRVREALELAIDRTVINQVVYNGDYVPTAQPIPPANPYHMAAVKPAARDVERAKALLREAGHPAPKIELMVPNSPDARQIGEIVQSMVKEAGIDLTLRATEFATSLNAAEKGDYDMYLLGWSGRVDPDGNIYSFWKTGGPLNYSKLSNAQVDKLIDDARLVNKVDDRRKLYEQAMGIIRAERSIIYLWHRKNIVAHTNKLSGYTAVPDGILRLQDVKLAN